MRPRLLTVPVLAVALSATAMWAAGCGGALGGGTALCTAAGCDDGVTFDLSGIEEFGQEDLTVETCVGHACRTQEFEASEAGQPQRAPMVMRTSPPGTYEPGQDLAVRMEVRGAGDRVLVTHEETVTLQAHHPNGPDCPPTCAQARVAPTIP